MYRLFVFFYFFYLSVNAQHTFSTLKGLLNKPQKQELWCVPASIQIVLSYYSKEYEQCEIYNHIQGKKCKKWRCGCWGLFRNCNECNHAYPIDSVSINELLKIIQNDYGLKNTELHTPTSITWDKIRMEIQGNIPIIFVAVGANGSSLHAFVAFDYQEFVYDCQPRQLIHIHNPYEKCKGCTYWISYHNNGRFVGTEFDTKYIIIPKI